MKKKRKIRWRPLLSLFTTLAAVGLFVFFGSRQERREIVGKAEAGYRYRFTLSTVWQIDEGNLHSFDADTAFRSRLDDHVFKLRPSPLMQWSYSHLLHRPPPPSPEIRLTSYTIQDLPTFNFLHRFQDGYPEPILESQERILTHRHLTVDGFPTTLVGLEKTESSKSHPGTQVLIDVSNHTIVYDLQGFSLSPSDNVNQEIQEILSSFHIEKAAG